LPARSPARPRGTGSGWSRLGSAVGRIFPHSHRFGGTQFNYSEFLGNSAAAAISNAYYAENRIARDAVAKMGVQAGQLRAARAT
jgi:hypothetical protein